MKSLFLHMLRLMSALTGLRDECPFDYEPCQCIAVDSEYSVTCNAVPVEEIRAVFQQTPITNHRNFYLRGNYTQIPADLLVDKRVQSIDIVCNGLDALEDVDVDAFRSSRDYATSIQFDNCNLTASNFSLSFLNSFTALRELSFHGGSLSTMQSLPQLPSLRAVQVSGAAGFQEWYEPSLTPSLSDVVIRSIGATGSEFIGGILDAVAQYNETVESLTLWATGLTSFPPQIRSLNALKRLAVSSDVIQVLTSDSVVLPPVKLETLDLGYLSIKEIEQDAFRGDLSSTFVFLVNNTLAAFDQAVFEPILQSMLGNTGRVFVDGNPITCDCGLSWLFDPSGSNLLRYVIGGVCSNGTAFEDLSSDGFSACFPTQK